MNSPKSTNPLGQLIVASANAEGFSRKEIVARLGYRNINKGYLRFDNCIRNGYFTPDLLERPGRVLELDRIQLSRAVEETRVLLAQQGKELAAILRQQAERAAAEEEARERASFRPHLWVMGERETPSPIFVVAICGQDRFRRVPLSEGIAALPDAEQADVICRAAARHFVGRSGSAGPFGNIVGFVYRRTFDEGWNLSADGTVIDRTAGRVIVGKAALFLKTTRTESNISVILK